MGLPSARQSLALWQQAAFAREGAELGESVQQGTNKLVQGAFSETAKSKIEKAGGKTEVM